METNRMMAMKGMLIFLLFAVHVFAAPEPGKIVSLDDCVRMGLEGNLSLRSQRIQLASASADVQRASAIYDTRLQLDGSWRDSELPPGSFPSQGGVEQGQLAGRLFRELSSGTQIGVELDVQRNLFEGVGTSSDPTWRTAAGITLRQSLWKNSFGAADRAQVDYVRQRLESLNLEYERSREQVAAQISDQYWSAVIARQVADAQSSVVQRLGKLLENNRRRVDEGMLDEIAVLSVEASLAVAEVDLETLRNDAAALDEQLKERINLPARLWDVTTIDYKMETVVDDDPSSPAFLDVFEHALRYRADVEALRREEQRVESLIRMRHLDDRANLEISGSIGRGDSDTKWSDTLDFDRTLWSVGVILDMSLDRSDTRAAVTQAFLEREVIRTEREMLERIIELNSRSAVRQMSTARRLVLATKRALDAQDRKLELELRRFNRGQSNTQTILDYENDRELAERDYLRSCGAYQRAKITLALVQGHTLPGDRP